MQVTPTAGLVAVLAVGIRAEELLADGGQGTGFEKLQPGLDGVVDIDLAAAADDKDAASTEKEGRVTLVSNPKMTHQFISTAGSHDMTMMVVMI